MGVPQGNLDQYIFAPDDPAFDQLPSQISTRYRRHSVSCYSWPGIHPKRCMDSNGKQLRPLMRTIHEMGGAAKVGPPGIISPGPSPGGVVALECPPPFNMRMAVRVDGRANKAPVRCGMDFSSPVSRRLVGPLCSYITPISSPHWQIFPDPDPDLRGCARRRSLRGCGPCRAARSEADRGGEDAIFEQLAAELLRQGASPSMMGVIGVTLLPVSKPIFFISALK
jgi:hypothetical protein